MTAKLDQIKYAFNVLKTEVQYLRAQNEILLAKVQTFDACMLLFTTRPAFSDRTTSPDPVWQMERALEEQDEKEQENG